jgi:hypothetical protein
MSCDTDRDWEQSAKVKQCPVVSTGSNSEILRERKKEEISTVNTACFLQNKGRYSTRNFIIEVKSLHYATIKKINAGTLQWCFQKLLVWALNTSECTKFNFLILLMQFGSFILHLIDLYP